MAFGLTLAVGRYEDRRAAVVAEANAIGTTYLRAQLLAEPVRDRSMALLRDYTGLALRASNEVPGSPPMLRTVAAERAIQRQLWGLAGQAMEAAPVANAPRLYVESLNIMIDQLTVRIFALGNRVPTAVLALELFGAAAALGLLGLYLSVLGRGWLPMLLAAALVTMLLLVIFAAAGHLRPGPADPRLDQYSVDPLPVAARVHESAARRASTPLREHAPGRPAQ